MARQPEIQYIRPYTDGSAARKLELNPQRRQPRTKLPRVRREQPLVIRLDAVAICGIVVAAVMLIMLFVGIGAYQTAQQETQQMAAYVSGLRNENAELKNIYQSGYDLKTVEKTALALGMIPKEEAVAIPVQVEEPEVEIQFYEPSFWEWFITFFENLFA